MICRICGHMNPLDAKVCSLCHHRINPGIREPMHCPHCGDLNGAGSLECRVCGYKLELVEAIPAARRTEICPYCQTRNPPFPAGSTAHCIGCGHLFGARAAYVSEAQTIAVADRGSMTLAQIDQALAQWGERLKNLDSDLVALDDNFTYKLLTAPGTPNSDPEGIARDRRAPLAAAVARTFHQRKLLQDTLDQAQRLRASIRWWWPSPETIQQISELLRGPSVAYSPDQPLGDDPNALDRTATPARMTLDELYLDASVALARIEDALAELARSSPEKSKS